MSNKGITRATFGEYARELIRKHSSIQALEWIPRIPYGQRTLYELRAQGEGFPGFRITEHDKRGKLVSASQREEYFPVYFVEPFKGNEVALGFDLASDPVRKAALESARDTGNMVATRRIRLVQEKAGQYGLLVFMPVYRKGLPSNAPEARRNNLTGFILGVFRIGDIVEKSLTGTRLTGINCTLYDVSAPEGEQYLHTHTPSSSAKDIKQGNKANPVSLSSLRYDKTLNIGGRTWVLVFTATPGYLASGRSWWPWGVLFACLLLTGLVAGYFMISARNIRLLSEVNAQLLGEIEEHKKTQDALNISEELYQTFIDASNDIVFLKDEQFRYRIVNKGYLKYIGRDEKEVIGKTGSDFRPPEITEQCDRSDMKVVESNALAVVEEASGDRIFETRKFPVMLGGNKTGIGCFMRDITEKKMTEKKLLESEEKYRSIFENAVEGIFQTTVDGHILSANNAIARMLGFSSPAELMGEAIDLSRRVYADPGDRGKLIKILEEQGAIAGFEVQLRKKDGGTIWVSLNTRAVKGNTGDILYLEGTMEDITSRKLAEEGLKRTLEKLRKTLAGTIQAVSLTIEARDPYTAGHQKRVSALARAIAQEMGLPGDTIDNIRIAGVVHDIGKISIPAETLSKPTQLTDIEFSLIKVHPQSGYDILKEAELPCPVAQIVLQHHERINGSGYPNGLKGEQILLEARILAVADVVEAISSYRPYRPSKGIAAALEEIEKNKAVLYDVEVVEACLRLFREKGFQLMQGQRR